MRRLAVTWLLALAVLACGGSSGGSSAGTSSGSEPTAPPTPKPMVITMNAVGGSGVTGTAEVVKNAGSFDLTLKLSGLQPNSTHIAHIHKGSCQNTGGIAYALQPILADATGKATVTSAIATMYDVPAGGWYANVHTGPDLTTPANAKSISCGDLMNG